MDMNISLKANDAKKIFSILTNSDVLNPVTRKKNLEFLVRKQSEDNKADLLNYFRNWYLQEGPHINFPNPHSREARYQAELFSESAYIAYSRMLNDGVCEKSEVKLATFSDVFMSSAWLSFAGVSSQSLMDYVEAEKDASVAKLKVFSFANNAIGVYHSQDLIYLACELEYVVKEMKKSTR